MRFRLLFAALLAGVLTWASCPPSSETTGSSPPSSQAEQQVYFRVNQVGYRSDDAKVALALAHRPVEGSFALVDAATDEAVYESTPRPSAAEGWGTSAHYYELDFSEVSQPGQYYLQLEDSVRSTAFSIGPEAYGHVQEDLLGFMRQQRCGYNPFLDMVCHRRDGRTFFGPMPDSTFVDASGGWHDAGDQLKYLITGSNATARMLLAYELEPDKFSDTFDAWGRDEPNGVPDVLDEARWGLRWLHKLHPEPDQLFHQVADDRDHIGWKWPDRDSSDYGWGPNSYRPVYFATGEPQGLSQYNSEATGIANLAGRYAAAMAMASRIWSEHGDSLYAAKNLRAAEEVYALGRANEGFQQGNSYGAPYRYNERTWADDMECGAAELYKVTGGALPRRSQALRPRDRNDLLDPARHDRALRVLSLRQRRPLHALSARRRGLSGHARRLLPRWP